MTNTPSYEFTGDLPDRIVLSGLSRLSKEQFGSLVGGIIDLGGAVELFNPAVSEAGEAEPLDLMLYQSDFTRLTDEFGLAKGTASRTWFSLIRDWSLWESAKNSELGGDLSSYEQTRLNRTPEWHQRLFKSDTELSLKQLRFAFDKDLLSGLKNLGPKCLQLIEVVLKDGESRLASMEDSDVSPTPEV